MTLSPKNYLVFTEEQNFLIKAKRDFKYLNRNLSNQQSVKKNNLNHIKYIYFINRIWSGDQDIFVFLFLADMSACNQLSLSIPRRPTGYL